MPFVDLAPGNERIAQEVVATIETMLGRNDWILGAGLEAFEAEFAAFCQARYAIGTDSGLSALELTLRALEIGAGDEVITAANTFVATALAISHVGATPVLVDVDPRTYTIDPALIERAITRRTRAVVPVHLYGQPADMESINDIAEAYGLVVVEDACQAHGARYKGRRVGSLGHAAAFSFYPSKNLGAYGDGGMVVTSDSVVAEAIKVLRNYGQREKYVHALKGFNRRLDTLQAAVLRLKLRYLDEANGARRSCAALYDSLLGGNGIVTPFVSPEVEPVWHLYVVRAPDRDGMRTWLGRRGVETGIHYPAPVHLQPAYANLGYPAGTFPVSERYAREILSLPMYPELDRAAIEYIAAAMHEFSEERLLAACWASLAGVRSEPRLGLSSWDARAG